MASDPFKFNIDAKYEPGPQGSSAEGIENPSKGKIQVRFNDEHGSFKVAYPDVFENYKVPKVTSEEMIDTWNKNPMQFWQNQLNFAVWCATTGCGVSYEDHLNSKIDLVKSVYRFHLYYQVRRILKEMGIKNPQDENWDAVNSEYNRRKYEKICDEFGGVPYNTDWRLTGPNNGLGPAYTYWPFIGLRKTEPGGEYDPKTMSFTLKTTEKIRHIKFILLDDGKAWRKFIIAKSKGFTKAGVMRLNASIRAYAWAVLGAQSITRSGILGTGTAFDAQKQFLVNVEEYIAHPVDLGSEIDAYENTLKYARSEVNFSLGIGLYMIPSDMLLKVGKIKDYNNMIVIATDDQPVGLHSGLNKSVAPPNAENDTGEEGIVKPDRGPKPRQPPAPTSSPPAPSSRPPRVSNTDHDDEKTALVAAGVVAGLLALWVLR